MECASFHHSDAKNFQVVSKFLENLCTPGLTYDKIRPRDSKRYRKSRPVNPCYDPVSGSLSYEAIHWQQRDKPQLTKTHYDVYNSYEWLNEK
jgi:hypothetical protein